MSLFRAYSQVPNEADAYTPDRLPAVALANFPDFLSITNVSTPPVPASINCSVTVSLVSNIFLMRAVMLDNPFWPLIRTFGLSVLTPMKLIFCMISDVSVDCLMVHIRLLRMIKPLTPESSLSSSSLQPAKVSATPSRRIVLHIICPPASVDAESAITDVRVRGPKIQRFLQPGSAYIALTSYKFTCKINAPCSQGTWGFFARSRTLDAPDMVSECVVQRALSRTLTHLLFGRRFNQTNTLYLEQAVRIELTTCCLWD